MAKRFTDSFKYRKQFIQSLPAPYKLFWDYLYHECTFAGIWDVEIEVAQIRIGQDALIEKNKALELFNSGAIRVIELNDSKKWFIRPFIDFQYGELVETNKLHIGVMRELKKEGVSIPLQRLGEGAKDKDKVKVIKGGVGGEGMEIIADLNAVLGTNYKPTAGKNKELIRARLKEGFTIEDFKTVHRKMAAAWGLDNKMRPYLRPITLYSSKFESYLNRPDDITQLTPQQQSNLKQLAQLNKELNNDHSGI